MTERSKKGFEGENNQKNENKQKDKTTKKDKCKPLTRVIIRRLPPTMSEDAFLKQIEPLPDHESYYFVPADWSLGLDSTSRAYINFINQDDIYLFKDRFDGYVFVDHKGAEYPAIVEFAPFQGLSRKCKKDDPKSKTIETDPHYLKFLEKVKKEKSETKSDSKFEFSFQFKSDKKITSTPLLQYLANKKQERKDEKKRRIEQKKKQREEERKKKRNQVTKAIPPSIKEEEVKSNTRVDQKSRDREKSFEKRAKDDDNFKKELRNQRKQERQEKRRSERPQNSRNDNSKPLQDTRKLGQKTDTSEQTRSAPITSILTNPNQKKSSNQINSKSNHEVNTDQKPIETGIEESKEKDQKITDKLSDNVREFFMSAAESLQSARKDSTSSTTSTTKQQDLQRPYNFDNKNEMSRKGSTCSSSDDFKKFENQNKSEERRREDRSARRIRNKDRPSIEIYQPGKMRLNARRDDNRSSNMTEGKGNRMYNVKSSCNDYGRKDIEETNVVKKKVSRYSEKRSNRAKEKELMAAEKLNAEIEEKPN